MKKLVIMSLAIAAITLVSCGAKTGSGNGNDSTATAADDTVQQTAKAAPIEGGTVYENAKYGYSLTLPANFVAQNYDKDVEEDNGGVMFQFNRNAITTSASTIEEATVEDQIKLAAEDFNKSEEGTTVISKDIKADRILVKFKCSDGLIAQYYIGKNKTMCTVTFWYDTKDEAAFNKDVDAVVASFKIN